MFVWRQGGSGEWMYGDVWGQDGRGAWLYGGQDGHGEWLYGGKPVMVSGYMETRQPL